MKTRRFKCCLTLQSSCKQHQAIVVVADSSYFQKDTDLCSWQSNITYQGQACTLQQPAVVVRDESSHLYHWIKIIQFPERIIIIPWNTPCCQTKIYLHKPINQNRTHAGINVFLKLLHEVCRGPFLCLKPQKIEEITWRKVETKEPKLGD